MLPEHLAGKSNLKIINATWYMPAAKRDGAKEHVQKRITKDTAFFDIDKVVLPATGLPHTMPPLDIFTEHMKRLGVQRTHDVICYDSHPMGIFSVARAAWMLRFFGV